MGEKKDNPSNAELLKIASDIVMSEYLTKKNDIHEKWIVESLYLWQTQGVRLSYPQLPPYPTDRDTLDKAKSLVEFLNTPRPDLGEEIKDSNAVNNITINNTQTITEEVKKEDKKDSLLEKFMRLLSFFTKAT